MAAPMKPASGPSSAATIRGSSRNPAPAAARRTPGGPAPAAGRLPRRAPADDHDLWVEGRHQTGQPNAEPAAHLVERLQGPPLAGARRLGHPGPSRPPWARPTRAMARPLEYCSQQPRCPHSQGSPSGTTCM